MRELALTDQIYHPSLEVHVFFWCMAAWPMFRVRLKFSIMKIPAPSAQVMIELGACFGRRSMLNLKQPWQFAWKRDLQRPRFLEQTPTH